MCFPVVCLFLDWQRNMFCVLRASRWGRRWQRRQGWASGWCRSGSRTSGPRWGLQNLFYPRGVHLFRFIVNKWPAEIHPQISVKGIQLSSLINLPRVFVLNLSLHSSCKSQVLKCEGRRGGEGRLQIYLTVTFNIYALLSLIIIWVNLWYCMLKAHSDRVYSLYGSFGGEPRGASFLN